MINSFHCEQILNTIIIIIYFYKICAEQIYK